MEDITLYLLHRDLRVYDNTTLYKALQKGLKVLPLFVFTKEQVGKDAVVKSEKFIQCMKQCLIDLNDELFDMLNVAEGDTLEVINEISKSYNIKFLFESFDVSPYAKLRQNAIAEWCEKNSVEYVLNEDCYLFPMNSILNKAGKPFQKFTSFYEKSKTFTVHKPINFKISKSDFIYDNKLNLSSTSLKLSLNKLSLLKLNQELIKNLNARGGRREGEYLLDLLHKDIGKHYTETHDIMAKPTSYLSVHHNLGSVSIRESYYATNNEDYRRQLIWRDFYTVIMYNFEELYGVNPYVFHYKTGKDLKDSDLFDYEVQLKSMTKEQRSDFEKWCKGETGVPLVDACMNQLNTSGYMHNRGRLLVSSYLIRDLKLSWRLGERYFSNHLLDYNFTQNFCNWANQDSVLPFGRPVFRTDKADSYVKRFDKNFEYLKRWSK
jgi:deoxyribodipyrimidine photo-lyase